MTAPLRLGARTSPLARAQVELVGAALSARGVPWTFVGVTTRGDVDRRHLAEIGGTGLFVGAVRDALRAGSIDVAVHSLKDLPTGAEVDIQVTAVPAREDTRDVLIGRRLADLGDGVRVGTGSPRRAMQLHDWAARSGIALEVVPVRGNVDTRIGLADRGELDAVVLAAAGLRRLGYLRPEPVEGPLRQAQDGASTGSGHMPLVVRSLPAEILDYAVMLPAPGQGALALETSTALAGDARAAVAALDDPVAHAEVRAERGFLAALEAGCTAPVGTRAVVKSVRGSTADLTLTAVIGRTLLSNLAEPLPADSVLRFEAHDPASEPWDFGVHHAGRVLTGLPDLPRPRR
ncbi:MAG TPA: hydroxymethylbilane synthase [Propionibacteriaceae bacterium]|nr:hydroxymethylbilane synthase [Propionibacteriaceae bacterium]